MENSENKNVSVIIFGGSSINKFIFTNKWRITTKTTVNMWSSHLISCIVFKVIYKTSVFLSNELADLLDLELFRIVISLT